jgi:methionyl-tRNA formyltransferase
VDKAEARVDWFTPADVLARRIRAFDPAPGLVTHWRGEPLKLWAAIAPSGEENNSLKPNKDVREGQILFVNGEGIDVQTGRGVLRLTEVQRAGGKRLPVRAFLSGCALAAGERLGEPTAQQAG